MIPKEISIQLVQLKEKVKTYSSVQRSLDVAERRDEVDEIKDAVENANNEIVDLSKKVNNILVDGLISKFEIENWFEELKDKSDFPEPNPREIYEEEQRVLERQRKVAEEKARQEREEYQKKLKTKRIEEYQNLCYYGPDDFDKVQQLIKDGFDIKQDGRIYDLSTLFNLGRSLKFIEFLIETGMKVNEDEQQELENIVKLEEEKAKRQFEESQKIIQTRRIEEFLNLCNYGPDDIDKVQKLIIDGLDLTKSNVCPSIPKLLAKGRRMKFIKYLVAEGMKITTPDILYCINSKSNYNSEEFLNVLISAKNIDQEAAEMVNTVLKEKAEEQRLNLEKLEKQLKQKAEDKRLLLELENNVVKLKAVTHGKYDSFYNLLKEGDLEDIKQVISYRLLEVNQRIRMNNSEVTYSILSIFESRSIEFIQLLVDSGYLVTKKNIDYYYDNFAKFPNYKQIVDVLITSKNIEKEAIDKVNEIKIKNERVLRELSKLEEEQKKEKERVHRELIEFEEEQKKEKEQKRLHYLIQSQIAEFRLLCYNGPDDIQKVQQLINEGFDITQRDVFYSLATIIERKRSIDFIHFLIDAGLFVSKNDIEFCIKNSLNPLCEELLNILNTSKNIDSNALVLIENRNQKRLQVPIDEFKRMCQYGQTEDLNKLQKLIKEGLDINSINDFDCLGTCIISRKSKVFISFLVDSGILVTSKHINYCFAHFNNKPPSLYLIKIFKNAKNIDNEAVAIILKRERAKRNQIIIGVIVVVVIIVLFYLFFEEIMGVFKILFIILLIPLLLPIILKKR